MWHHSRQLIFKEHGVSRQRQASQPKKKVLLVFKWSWLYEMFTILSPRFFFILTYGYALFFLLLKQNICCGYSKQPP